MTPEEVRCPVCRLRVRASSAQITKIDPASKCQHRQGWTVCPNLKLALSEARSQGYALHHPSLLGSGHADHRRHHSTPHSAVQTDPFPLSCAVKQQTLPHATVMVLRVLACTLLLEADGFRLGLRVNIFARNDATLGRFAETTFAWFCTRGPPSRTP